MRPEEDARLKALVADVDRRLAAFRAAASALRARANAQQQPQPLQPPQEALQPQQRQSSRPPQQGQQQQQQQLQQQRRPDVALSLELARAHVALAALAAEAAHAAERFALQLRDLTSAAQTENDLFVQLRRFTQGAQPGGGKHDRHMVVKRQADNAHGAFRWLSRELEGAETQAERLIDSTFAEARGAVQRLVACRAAVVQHARSTDEVDKELDALEEKLAAGVSGIVDQSKVQYLLRMGRETAGVPELRKTDSAHALSQLGSARELGKQGGAHAVNPLQYETPYRRAMISKHGPSILAQDERNGLDEPAQQPPPPATQGQGQGVAQAYGDAPPSAAPSRERSKSSTKKKKRFPWLFAWAFQSPAKPEAPQRTTSSQKLARQASRKSTGA
jgi:hypothetical protein